MTKSTVHPFVGVIIGGLPNPWVIFLPTHVAHPALQTPSVFTEMPLTLLFSASQLAALASGRPAFGPPASQFSITGHPTKTC
jgi:hypothetical protein